MNAPTHLSVRLAPEVAQLLHRISFETGRSKKDLVTAAILNAYSSTDASGTPRLTIFDKTWEQIDEYGSK